MMQIVLFEDDQVGRLEPITLARPAYAIRCGTLRLIDLVAELGQSLRGLVRPHLRDIQRLDNPQLQSSAGGSAEPQLLVNARLVPSVENYRVLERLVAERRPTMVGRGDCLAAALLPPGSPSPGDDWEAGSLREFLARLSGFAPADTAVNCDLFEYPHDVVRYHLRVMQAALERRLARGNYRELADGVFAAGEVGLHASVITDTRGGPIVLEAGAQVGPFSLLTGPIHLGAGARVNPHSVLKTHVALGNQARIGGEVAATIVESYSNKQHFGYLGHSYLGSWVNLGAGTTNSDLKNTYGDVQVESGSQRLTTGMQFFGCIIGDYTKSAIHTGIFTGKMIGACSTLYGYVTTNVPSFVNYARLFGQVSEIPAAVVVATQQRMFRRRDVAQRPCDVQLIHDMYQLTRGERQQLTAQPLQL